MPTPQLVSVTEFSESQYAQMVDSSDLQIDDILVKAEAAVQSRIGRRIAVTSYTEVFTATSQTVFLRQRPLVAVTSLRRRISVVHPWVTLDQTRVQLETGPGYITSYDRIAGYQIEVVYTAGYDPIPEDIKEAVIMQAVLFSYQDLEVYGAGDGKSPGILYFNQDIDRYIAPYRANATVYH